jgi:hypothetical protein
MVNSSVKCRVKKLDRWNFRKSTRIKNYPECLLKFFCVHIRLMLLDDYRQHIVIDSSFVEQVEEPAIYLPLYGFMWCFGIKYNVDKSSYSSLSRLFIIRL